MKQLILLIALFVPALQADIYDIERFSLSNYQGKVVYLDFWASWCKPCQKSFPWMNDLTKKFPTDQFEVVTINLDQETQVMHDFLARVPAEFDIYHDASGKVAEQFKLEGMPTSFLIDRNGKIISTHIGFYEKKKQQLEAEIEDLL